MQVLFSFLASLVAHSGFFGAALGAAFSLIPAVDDPGIAALGTLITAGIDTGKVIAAGAVVFGVIMTLIIVLNVGPNWAIGKAKRVAGAIGSKKA